jgi:hypothetical protein
MDHLTPGMFASWQNFYVIVGSSAGALTGLQFVVITLVAQARAAGNIRDIHAFATPTVMQFCTALLLSALMTAPWQSVAVLGGCLAACGLAGTGYSFRIVWHARNAAYQPEFEDWVWYVASPLLAHLVLVAAGVLICSATRWALVPVAADVLMFLLLGVHNAWDAVTFIAVQHRSRSSGSDQDTST